MSDEEKEQSIKIVDKRRFSDDGAEREESRTESSKVAAPAEKPAAAAKEASQEKAAPAEKVAGAGAESGQRRSGSPAVNFNNFILGLGTQALVLMGEIPNPETGLVNANLSAAKQTIDILGMLEEKTKGNLAEDEVTLFTEVLSSLRLAFVDRVNSKS